jgi:hypothetical protein
VGIRLSIFETELRSLICDSVINTGTVLYVLAMLNAAQNLEAAVRDLNHWVCVNINEKLHPEFPLKCSLDIIRTSNVESLICGGGKIIDLCIYSYVRLARKRLPVTLSAENG